jgi:hypothetical protein
MLETMIGTVFEYSSFRFVMNKVKIYSNSSGTQSQGWKTQMVIYVVK